MGPHRLDQRQRRLPLCFVAPCSVRRNVGNHDVAMRSLSCAV